MRPRITVVRMTRRFFLERTVKASLMLRAAPAMLMGMQNPSAEVAFELKNSDDLTEGFSQPPDSARPWVFWFWLNGNITREGITADLEAMQRVGIGGAWICNCAGAEPG